MTALNKQAIDFSQPLETESGEPVKYICHDVIEYKCARVCVDIATGVVYSSPYVGIKIRNKEANPRAKLREQIESAADAYWHFDNGWISDMKCGDRSHEYLLFVKDPKNVLALLDELEAAEKRIAEHSFENQLLANADRDIKALRERIEELECALEAQKVTVPEVRITVAESKHKNLTWRELGAYNEGAGVAKEAILAAIRAAGIKIKGE